MHCNRLRVWAGWLCLCLCSAANGANTLHSKVCVDSGEKWVTGQYGRYRVHRPCWRWQLTYKVVDGPHYQHSQQCVGYQNQGCGQVQERCQQWDDEYGFCALSLRTFHCPQTVVPRHTELCGDLLTCPNGDCSTEYHVPQDRSDDFAHAATHLAVADTLAEAFDVDTLSVFNGTAQSCTKDRFAFADCCADRGWGSDLGLAQCDAQAQTLGVKRTQGATHYVGRYCRQDSPLGCLKTRYVYCSYGSKLARIVVEQGRAQMGRDYGSAKQPQCRGFTLDELQTLDVNAMDFSEFYQDISEQAASATFGDLQQWIDGLIDRMQPMDGGAP